jgi:predicted DNA-binding transcriptional regulator YafY
LSAFHGTLGAVQASRLLSILLRLQTQGRLSATALAQSFEVSVRTIYRDIDQLSAAGVPVYAEKGRHGGFVLREGYRTQLTGLDRPEAESLFLAGLPDVATQLGLGPALNTTRMKLLASLPEALRRDAEAVAARFFLDPVAWFQGADEQPLLQTLAAAVWSRRMVRLRYDSWKAVVERRVSPLGLVLKGGLWYLVAAADTQPRTYRVGSIQQLMVEEEHAVAPARFDLQRYWRSFTRDYESRMQTAQAQVRANTNGLRRLAGLSHALAQAVAAAKPADSEGWHRLTIPIESVAAAVNDLLPLAPDVQALGPAALRKAMRDSVRLLAQIYTTTNQARRKS